MKLLLKGLIICFYISFITNINVNASEQQDRLETQLEEIGIEDVYSENIAEYVYYYVLDDEKIEEVVQRGEKIASTLENKSSLTDFKFNDLISIYNDFNFITKTLNLKLNFSLRDKSIEIKEKNDNKVLIKANLEQISSYYNNYVNDFAQEGIMTIVKEEKKQKREKAVVASVDVNDKSNNEINRYNNEQSSNVSYSKNKEENLQENKYEESKSTEEKKNLKSDELESETKKDNLLEDTKANNNLSNEKELTKVNNSKQESDSFNINNLPQGKSESRDSEEVKINIDNNQKYNVTNSNINEDEKAMANILNNEESNEVINNLVYTKNNTDTFLWIAVMIIALIGVLVSAKRLIRG